MPLGPIGDIGQQPLEAADVFEVGWSTQIEWDQGTYKRNTLAGNGEVEITGFQDDFESGTLDKWDVNNATITTGRARGTYSMYASTGVSGDYQARTRIAPGGGDIPDFVFHYQETTNSTGGGFRFKNSDGEYEIGIATDNPEWEVTDADGTTQLDGGSNYDDWHRVEVTFDWSAGTCDISWQNLATGRSGTYSNRNLRVGKDVEYAEFWEYNAGGWGASDIVMWIDDVSMTSQGSGRYITTEKTFSEPLKPSLTNLDYTLNGGGLEITAIGSPGSPSQEKQTGYISSGTEQGLDWENAHSTVQLDITLIRGTGSPVLRGASLAREDVELDAVYDLYPEVGDSPTITANVINHTTTSETFDVTITLPTEMSTSDPLTKTTGAIGEEQSGSVSWTVSADTAGIGTIDLNLTGNTSGYTTLSPAPVEIMDAGVMTWGGKFEWDNCFDYDLLKHHGGDSDFITPTTKSNPGYLITRTKSFANPIEPDLVQMDYDTNVNKVEVQVTGSPNTASSETKTVTLVDNPIQEITDWSSTHTEYQLRIDLDMYDSTSENNRPEFRSVSLGTATTDTNVSWSATEDWDANRWENGVSHAADVVTFSPVWRQEYDFPTGSSTTSVNLHHNSFIAQRDFYGHARVTSMNSNGWTYKGSVEFGEIVDANTDDWDKIKEKVAESSGQTTEVIKNLTIEKNKEYFLGYSRGYYYNAAEYDTSDAAEVVGDRSEGFKTEQFHTRLGGNNAGNTLGFSKLEFKESYFFSDFKYTTREVQPSISDMNYDVGNLDAIKLAVIGSPETPNPEKHVIDLQGEGFKDIQWTNSHLKFEIQVIATDSDGSTTFSSLVLDDAVSPDNAIVAEQRETEVDLSWSNPITFDEVRVYRAATESYDLGDYTLVDTLLGSATSYTDSGLTTWEDYYYVIVGVQGSYLGASEPASAVPYPSNAVGWHSKEDWDAGQDELGVAHEGMHPRLIKAEPKLAKINAQNLEYYFPFDGDLIDYSGNRNHATMTRPNVGFVDGKIGQALEINATALNDHVPLNHSFSGSPEFGSATFSLWVWCQQNGYDDADAQFDVLTYDASEYIRIYANSNSVGGDTAETDGCGIYVVDANGNGTYNCTGEFIDDGEWHHLVFVLDRYNSSNENVRCFVDGEKVATSTRGQDIGYGSGATRYGIMGQNTEGSTFDYLNRDGSPPSEGFEGYVDDLRFYRSYAMTDEEVKYLYKYGNDGAYHTTSIKSTPTDANL